MERHENQHTEALDGGLKQKVASYQQEQTAVYCSFHAVVGTAVVSESAWMESSAVAAVAARAVWLVVLVVALVAVSAPVLCDFAVGPIVLDVASVHADIPVAPEVAVVPEAVVDAVDALVAAAALNVAVHLASSAD